MSRILCHFGILLVLALTAGQLPAAEPPPRIRTLLITGGHAFEQPAFFKVFRENPELIFETAAHGKTNATAYDQPGVLDHEVIVLYDMPKTITAAEQAVFNTIFQRGIGLVVLHHALVSYQHWPEYERIIGGRYPEADGQGGVVTAAVGYEHDREVPVVIVAKDHPITAGLRDFVIHDEIYWGFRVAPDVTPLLTTTDPKSAKPLGWCRIEGRSRVVYLQLGHDHQAYANPNYQKLVAQAIRWAAKK